MEQVTGMVVMPVWEDQALKGFIVMLTGITRGTPRPHIQDDITKGGLEEVAGTPWT